MSGIPQFCMQNGRVGSNNTPSEKHAKSSRKSSYSSSNGKNLTGSNNARCNSGPPPPIPNGHGGVPKSSGAIPPNTLQIPTSPGRSMIEKFQLFRAKNKSKESAQKCSSSSSGFSSARSEKSDSSGEANNQQQKKTEVLVTLGSTATSGVPNGPMDMKSYRSKVSKLTAHRPDPCTVAMNLSKTANNGPTNNNNNSPKSQSVESLPFTVNGGHPRVTARQTGTYQGHSTEVSGATILRMKGNKSSLPHASALAKSQYNRYSASGIPMRHSMGPDESKIVNLAKGTGIPKPTAAVKGTSKASEPEPSPNLWYPQAVANGPCKGNVNGKPSPVHAMRRKQEQVAMVSPMLTPVQADDLVKASQKSIKHSAEALAEVAASSPRPSARDSFSKEPTPPTGKSEEEEDVLLNVKPMEPLKRSSPYKYSNGKQQGRFFNKSASPSQFQNHYGNLNGPQRYIVSNQFAPHGPNMRQEVWLCDKVRGPEPQKESCNAPHQGNINEPPEPAPSLPYSECNNKPSVSEMMRNIFAENASLSGTGGGRRKVKISGGTQTEQQSDSEIESLFRKNRNSCNLNQYNNKKQGGRSLHLAASENNSNNKSLSLTGSVASQLSEGLREKILSSQSLPKWGNNGRTRKPNWEEESVKSQPPLSLYPQGDEVYSYLGYASSVMTEPLRSEGDHGSCLSLVSTTFSSYSGHKGDISNAKGDPHKNSNGALDELKKMRRELRDAKDKARLLSHQLQSSERERERLRDRLESAERLCMDAGLGSRGDERGSNLTSRQLSTDSISSDHTNVSSTTNNNNGKGNSYYDHGYDDHSSSNKKKNAKHRSWLRSSFTRAFTKRSSSVGSKGNGCEQSDHGKDGSVILSPGNNNGRVSSASEVDVRSSLPQIPLSPPTSSHNGHGVHSSPVYEEMDLRGSEGRLNCATNSSRLELLEKQVREKEMALTDIRLEALNSAQQIESLKDNITELQYKIAMLEEENDELKSWRNECECDCRNGEEEQSPKRNEKNEDEIKNDKENNSAPTRT